MIRGANFSYPDAKSGPRTVASAATRSPADEMRIESYSAESSGASSASSWSGSCWQTAFCSRTWTAMFAKWSAPVTQSMVNQRKGRRCRYDTHGPPRTQGRASGSSRRDRRTGSRRPSCEQISSQHRVRGSGEWMLRRSGNRNHFNVSRARVEHRSELS